MSWIKQLVAASAAAAALAVAAPSQASVTYVFHLPTVYFVGSDDGDDDDDSDFAIIDQHFTYVSPDFVTAYTDIPGGDLPSCVAVDSATHCTHVQFYVDSSAVNPAPDHYDVVGFNTDDGTGESRVYVYFDNGAFDAVGVYQARFSAGTLTVTQTPDAVPEPATWGLMILGFGAMGARLRHGRRLSPRPA